MASLREAARAVLDDARDAIGYLIIWKEGRSWNSEVYYEVQYDDYDGWKIESDVIEDLQEIVEADPNAIAVNAYYDNLGELEDMTLDSLVDGIRYQYEIAPGSLAHALSQAA